MKSGSKNSTLFLPHPHPTPGNPQYTFPLSFPQQRYNQKKISFGGQEQEGEGIWVKTVKSQQESPQIGSFPLVILFTLIFGFSFSLLTPFFFWKSKEKRRLPGGYQAAIFRSALPRLGTQELHIQEAGHESVRTLECAPPPIARSLKQISASVRQQNRLTYHQHLLHLPHHPLPHHCSLLHPPRGKDRSRISAVPPLG